MTEAVQQRLELRVRELHDLVELGIFSQKEIKIIVKKREDFEYSLRRRQTKKQDYLDYIEYEKNLENLRKLRKKALHIKSKKHVSDGSIIHYIHKLYHNGLKKFKDDVNMWFDYFEFCKAEKSFRKLGRAFAECLQMHSDNPKVWIQAAQWEWQHNTSVKAARALYQRGLRVNKNSKDLWLEYFRMELGYWDTILKRAKALGIDIDAQEKKATDEMQAKAKKLRRKKKKNLDSDEEEDDDEEEEEEEDANNDLISESEDEFDEEKELEEAKGIRKAINKNAEDSDDEENKEDEEVMDEEEDDVSSLALAKKVGVSFYSGYIPRVVYFHAMENFVDDYELVDDFLSVYRSYDDTEPSREQIYGLLPPSNAQALDLLCRKPVDDHSSGVSFTVREKMEGVVLTHKNYEEAVKQTQLVELKELHVKFLKGVAEYFQNDKEAKKVSKQLYEKACISYCDDSHPPVGAFAVFSGKKGIALIENYLEDASHKQNLDAWKAYLNAYMQEVSPTKKKGAKQENLERSILDVFKKAVDALEYESANEMVGVAWQWCINQNNLENAEYFACVAVEKKVDIARKLICAHLEVLGASSSSDAVEKFCDWVSMRPLAQSVDFFCLWTSIELKNNTKASKVREIFQSAIGKYGKKSARLWLEFIQFEEAHGDTRSLRNVNYLCSKSLENQSALQQLRIQSVSN